MRSADHVQSAQLETSGGLPDALIEGIEWPSGSGKSVVVMALRDHTVVPNFMNVFLKTSQSSDIDQSVSVLHGNRFVSYRIGNDVYHVGTLSLVAPVQHPASRSIRGWWSSAVVVFCGLMAALSSAPTFAAKPACVCRATTSRTPPGRNELCAPHANT